MSKMAFAPGEYFRKSVYQYIVFPWMEGGTGILFFFLCRGLFFENLRPTGKIQFLRLFVTIKMITKSRKNRQLKIVEKICTQLIGA